MEEETVIHNQVGFYIFYVILCNRMDNATFDAITVITVNRLFFDQNAIFSIHMLFHGKHAVLSRHQRGCGVHTCKHIRRPWSHLLNTLRGAARKERK